MPCLTRAVVRLTLASVLTAVLPLAPASAEKRIAFTIGIDTYDNLTAGQQLRKAVNDSRSVGAALASVGFEIVRGENVPRLEFNRIWQRFLNRIEPGDTVSVFFAGHGVEIGGVNYLLARDVPKVTTGEDELLKGETIALARLLEDLRARQPKVSVLILDACRNNPFQQQGGRSVGGSRGLARVEAPEGTFVMFSAGNGEAALDRLGDNDSEANSVYTRKLLPLLTRTGLSLPDMAQEVRRQVRDLAASVRHRQTPAYYDEVVGRFCMASCGDGEKPAQVAVATPALPAPLPPLEPVPSRISAPNEALPADLPVRPEVLRTIETDPFFANAPPVRVGAHTIISNLTSTTGGAGTMTSSFNDETATRWLRSGLIRQDLTQRYTVNNSGAVGRYSTRSSSFAAGNGLFTLSYRFVATGQRTSTTSRLLRIENMRGSIFPVTLGKKFSYDSTSEWNTTGGSSGTSTSRNSCTVTKKFDAKTFHASLAGDAYLLVCDTESTEKNGSITKSRTREVFVDMLGIWLRADPVSPKEQLISNNESTTTQGYTTITNGTYTLASFRLAQ